jgi:lathosterol oxidase
VSRKTNPEFPSPESIRGEIIQMLKGLVAATFCPALSLYLSKLGYSKGFCGVSEEYGWGYHAVQLVVVWVTVDFFEYAYHYFGHRYSALWNVHKHHHHFPNPSPFAVIADEAPDQLVRASPLVIVPLLVPANQDLLFFQFAVMFYLYGTYLHWGFESPRLSAHQPWINTAYHHYMHHALSIKNRPFYTGFFFKLWDQLFGTHFDGPCRCAACEQAAGRRTRQQYANVAKPDYTVLLKPSFWMTAKTKA